MLSNYSSWFLDTPVMSHAFYFAVSLVLAGLFLWRRQDGDVPMAALQLAAMAFAASFFIISIACDYRYLYFTDLAALAGLLYAAVDPPTPWRKKLAQAEAVFPLGRDVQARLARAEESIERQLAAEAEALHLDLLEQRAHQGLDLAGVVDVLVGHHLPVVEAVAQAELQPGRRHPAQGPEEAAFAGDRGA